MARVPEAEPVAVPKRSRSKALLLLGIALAAVVALGGATQVWVTLDLIEGAAAFELLEATGQQLNASLSPIAIAALAAALALTIAGRWLRWVLGALVALLGAGVFAISTGVLRDPWGAATVRLAESTGLAGHAQQDLIVSSATSPFIAIVLTAGAALVLLGAAVVVLSGRWRTGGRRYQAGSGETRTVRGTQPDRISEWDELSDGHDPTGNDDTDGDVEGDFDGDFDGDPDHDEPGLESPEPGSTR